MKKMLLVSAVAAASLSLAACGGGKAEGKLDKGQVVATVDGQEITVFELNAEMQNSPAPPGADRKLLEQMALQRIIDRKILAKIALDQKLDQTPAFLLQERRAREVLLAQMLREKIASGITQPTDTEIAQYQKSHPERFAERKIYAVDQILFPPPTSEAKFRELAPLKTLDQLAAKLGADGTRFRRGNTQIDTVQLPGEVVQKMAALPAGEMFILPSPQGLTANVITATTVQPLTGADARTAAINALRAERFAKASEAQLGDLIKKARESVTYQAGYSAPPQLKGGKAPAAGGTGTPAAPAATPSPSASASPAQ